MIFIYPIFIVIYLGFVVTNHFTLFDDEEVGAWLRIAVYALPAVIVGSLVRKKKFLVQVPWIAGTHLVSAAVLGMCVEFLTGEISNFPNAKFSDVYYGALAQIHLYAFVPIYLFLVLCAVHWVVFYGIPLVIRYVKNTFAKHKDSNTPVDTHT